MTQEAGLPEPFASTGALKGLRVLDLSRLWAGPSLTEVLGNMGAEVIKVESRQALDLWRIGGARDTAEEKDGKPRYELASIFNAVNRNKLGITLDLSHTEGCDVFKRLVEMSDVVVENYSARVMAKFGLDYEALRAVNERIVMMSMPAFGMTGPWRDFVGLAYSTEGCSGFPHLTGYEGGPPMLWGPAGADSFAGVTGAIAVLAALHQRRRSGCGQFIDLSQVESVATWLGPHMIDYCWNGTEMEHHGNGHPHMAPHGCYRAAGEDRWLVVAVENDEQWERLCQTIGRSDWLERADLSAVEGRMAARDELDRGLSEWSQGLDNGDAADVLQRAAVAAAPVLRGDQLLDDPQLIARNFVEWHERKLVGRRAYSGMWAKFSKTPGTIRFPAPTLGEHNDLVLRGLLGLSEQEMDELESSEIIGTVPIGPVRSSF